MVEPVCSYQFLFCCFLVFQVSVVYWCRQHLIKVRHAYWYKRLRCHSQFYVKAVQIGKTWFVLEYIFYTLCEYFKQNFCAAAHSTKVYVTFGIGHMVWIKYMLPLFNFVKFWEFQTKALGLLWTITESRIRHPSDPALKTCPLHIQILILVDMIIWNEKHFRLLIWGYVLHTLWIQSSVPACKCFGHPKLDVDPYPTKTTFCPICEISYIELF